MYIRYEFDLVNLLSLLMQPWLTKTVRRWGEVLYYRRDHWPNLMIETIWQILNNKGDWSVAPMTGQFMLDVKRQYLANLGNVPGSDYEHMDPEKIEKKLEICREYLKMLELVHPGYNYQKSKILICCTLYFIILCVTCLVNKLLQYNTNKIQFSSEFY